MFLILTLISSIYYFIVVNQLFIKFMSLFPIGIRKTDTDLEHYYNNINTQTTKENIMNTIYTTQTEFTKNTTVAAVEQFWNDASLSKEEVAAKLNTTVQVLREVKRKNKRFSKVMTSERAKGLPGYIINSDVVEESIVEEVSEDSSCDTSNYIPTEKITLTFTTTFRDEEVSIPVEITKGSTMWKDVEQSLLAHGQHLSEEVMVYVKGTDMPATYKEVLTGVYTEYEIKQNVKGN